MADSLDVEIDMMRLRTRFTLVMINFELLCFATGLRAQSQFPLTENGTVLKWESKTYSQSAHITRSQVVYSVRVGRVV